VITNDRKSRRPDLRLAKRASAAPKWLGRGSVLGGVGLGVIVWLIVAGAAWLAARALG